MVGSLDLLEKQIYADFEYLNISSNDWVINSEKVLNVVIIGAGMSALAVALALKAEGISCTLFESKNEGEEGPWLSPALMQTLRSPKTALGPTLVSPSLSFQAWFKAQFGDDRWENLDKIPRIQWHEYLQWFKKVTSPNIKYRHELVDLEVIDGGNTTQVTILTPNGKEKFYTKHLILALGLDSFSTPNIPDYIDSIPTRFWEHSYAGTEYSRFKGLDIGVIGYSAGAMDSAATALECGAKSVELLCRCSDFPRVNRSKVASNQGYLQSYPYWTDEQKWNFQLYLQREKTPAPHGSTLRVSKHENAYFNFKTNIQHIEYHGDKLHVYSEQDCFVLDYLILATGFKTDWSKSLWSKKLKDSFKVWEDVYDIPFTHENKELSQQPYLGPSFEFYSKKNSNLVNIYAFNLSAGLSHGPLVGMIGGTYHGARVLAQSIARKLYQDNYEEHLLNIKQSNECELYGYEWRVAERYSQRVEEIKGFSE